MILSDYDLLRAMNDGLIQVKPFSEGQLGPSSIDLHLGDSFVNYELPQIILGQRPEAHREVLIDPSQGYLLEPNGFVLANTLEEVTIGAFHQGWVETKGNIARAGIQVHCCDGHVDPGFCGTITLELKNNNSVPILIYPRIRICQLFVSQLTSECRSPYRGKYQNQKLPTTYAP